MTHPLDTTYHPPGYGRWRDIFRVYVPRLTLHFVADSKRGRCPLDGCTGTFKLDYNFELEGYGRCDTCMDREMDGIGLLMHFNGCSRRTALKAIAAIDEDTPPYRRPPHYRF